MSNYYEKQGAKVNIAHELMARNWDVQGYSPDESDSMTDYYCPAHWSGIATKNGYILVVDNSYSAEAKEITKYNPKGNLSFEDREKINKLEKMTQANGATVGEEENAKQLINKIKEKVSTEPAYEVIGMSLAHMANPKGSIWHIEKDGKIYDKGNALTKFDDMPKTWQFDFIKMEYKDSYKHWGTISEEKRKVINEFKALILRFERVVSGMNSMGDGTAETEKTGLEQQEKAGYEKVIKNITKKVIKPIEKADKTININDVLSFSYHGHYWIVTEIYNNNKGQTCVVYELLGSEKRGYQRLSGISLQGKRYYQQLSRLEKEITEGKTKVYTLQEVEEITPTEKWVKIDKSQKPYNSKPQTKPEEPKTEPKTEQKQEQAITEEYTITADTDTRDNSPLWVVKLNRTLTKEEYQKVSNEFKTLKGYYSKFKHGFIFRYDPTTVLSGNSEAKTEQTVKEQTKATRSKAEETAENIIDASTDIITELKLTPAQYPTNEEYRTALKNYVDKHNIKITDDILDYIRKQELFDLVIVLEYFNIKDGFMYDCHFKAWDMSMDDIKNAITALNISYIDYGEKIGFKGITAEQTRQVKGISDKNNSMFFIDKEEKERKIYSAEININSKLNGIELKFVTEPDEQCKVELKQHGFRYSQFNKIWYAVYNERNLQKACTITGNTIEQYREAI